MDRPGPKCLPMIFLKMNKSGNWFYISVGLRNEINFLNLYVFSGVIFQSNAKFGFAGGTDGSL